MTPIPLLIAAVVVPAELVLYFCMYRSSYGRAAVYRAKFAWFIDVLAIMSGFFVSAAAIYSLDHPELFTVAIDSYVFWVLFLFGSSQATMHLSKWAIRLCCD